MDATQFNPAILANLFAAAGNASSNLSKLIPGLKDNQSKFGPPTQLSVGGGPLVTGFSDYTNLGKSGVWQFDLSSVMGTGSGSSGIPQMHRSKEQQAVEVKAIETALEYVNGGDIEAGRKLMNELLDENPTNAAAVQVLGLAAQAEGKYEEAEQLFMKAHAIEPATGYDNDAANARILQKSDSEVYRKAVQMLEAPSRKEEGIRLLMTLTERNPDHVAGRVQLAEALLDQGDGNNGLMQYNNAIRSAANDSELRLVENGLDALAREVPNSAYVQQLLGKVYLKQERYDQALQTLTMAANMADNPVTYWRDLATAYVGVGNERLERGDVTGALSAYGQAKEYSPTSTEVKAALAGAYVERAEQRMQQRNYDGAIEDLRQAKDMLRYEGGSRELRERAAHSAYAIGLKFQRQREAGGGEIDGEVLAFQIAHDLDEDNSTYKQRLAETRNALGDQHMANGEYEEAAAAYRRAHELYTYNETYKENAINAYVTWGDERFNSYNFDDAVEAYLEAFKLDTSNDDNRSKLAEAYDQRGLEHFEFERYEDALADFKNALALYPDNADYQDHYDMVRAWDMD